MNFGSPKTITDGLVFYFDFANNGDCYVSGSTTAKNLVAANNSTVSSAVGTLATTPSAFGYLPSSNFGTIKFAGGSTTIITVPVSDSMKPTTSITQEVWVKPSNIVLSQKIINLQYQSALNYSYSLFMDVDGAAAPMWCAGINTSPITVTTDNSITGKWYHFVHTYDGEYQILYLNGVSIGAAALSGVITYDPTNTLLSIGKSFTSTNTGGLSYFDGTLSMMCIYNRALSGNEVMTNFNSFRARFGI